MSKTRAYRAPRTPTGYLSVLNTGAGDIVVTFNDHSDAEAEQAIKMLLDMQKRGYAILVRQDDGTYQRAVSINRETKSYVVQLPSEPPTPAEDEAPPKRERRSYRRAEQPIKGRKAVAVARSAGGCAPRSPLAMLAQCRVAKSSVSDAGGAP